MGRAGRSGNPRRRVSGARVPQGTIGETTQLVRAPQDPSGSAKEGMEGRRLIVNPIDEALKDEIRARARATEEAREVVNRRALARDFGVSPQTVARVLDGSDARRGEARDPAVSSSEVGSLGGLLMGLALTGLWVWATWRAGRRRGR
jgi:hypothetical protein